MNLNNYAERVVSESSETTLFLNFDAFKGFALKNPMRGVAPQPHELALKSSTKTFNCHRQPLAKHSERSERKSFLPVRLKIELLLSKFA